MPQCSQWHYLQLPVYGSSLGVHQHVYRINKVWSIHFIGLSCKKEGTAEIGDSVGESHKHHSIKDAEIPRA